MGSDSAHDLKLVRLMGILYSGQIDNTFSSHIRNAHHFSDNRGRIVRCGLLLWDYSSAARTSSLLHSRFYRRHAALLPTRGSVA